MLKRYLLLLQVAFVMCTALQAQKKDLTPDDYGNWQTLATTGISPDGEWMLYHIMVQEDNDTMYVVNKNANKTYKLAFAANPEFSGDNQWLAYRVGVSYKESEKLREQNKTIEFKMGLLNLWTGKIEEIRNINRFGFSRNGKFLAAYLNPPKDNKDKGAVLLVKDLAAGTTRTIGNVTEYAFNKKQ
jgi:hypothetical protein